MRGGVLPLAPLDPSIVTLRRAAPSFAELMCMRTPALFSGMPNVRVETVRAGLVPVLRHREGCAGVCDAMIFSFCKHAHTPNLTFTRLERAQCVVYLHGLHKLHLPVTRGVQPVTSCR